VSAFVLDVLTDEDRLPRYRGNPNILVGQCYVVSEVVYHRLKAQGYNPKPMFMRHEGQPHWFVLLGGVVLDYTADQFATRPDYRNAIGKGFLTKQPSKRARTIMERMDAWTS